MPLKKDLWLKYHLNFPIAGGYGNSEEDAIEILLENGLGILLEKDIIAYMFCDSNYDFVLIWQKMIESGDKYFDILKIKLASGEIREVFFDISNFFGKSDELFFREGHEHNELFKKMLVRPDSEEEKSWFN